MLVDDIARELPNLRAHAESLMLDAGRAFRPNDGTDEDPGRVKYDPTFQEESDQVDPLYTSRCKIQSRNVQPRDAEVGGRTSTEVRTELHLPVATPPLTSGDVWEITAAHPMSLAVVGQRLRVTAPVAGTLKTARRYEVEEVVS